MSDAMRSDDARKNRILEAALIEFADKGYKKASTNTIVREANVSKGLLFHYFISKRDLYILIYKNVNDSIMKEFVLGVNFADKDVINRLKSSIDQKIKVLNNNPMFVSILEKNIHIQDESILEETALYKIDYHKREYAKIFSDIDYYLFNDAINIDRSLDVVRWTLDRIILDWQIKYKYRMTSKLLEIVKTDLVHYIDLFKVVLYR